VRRRCYQRFRRITVPWPLIPKRQWPAVQFKDKRAITREEHQRILAAEGNAERKPLYQLCWHLGGSQGDIANLKGEDVDWASGTVSFFRRKTGVPVIVHLGTEALNLFKDLPATGPLFPYLCTLRAGDRATEFKQRCAGSLGSKGCRCTRIGTCGRSGRSWRATRSDSRMRRWGTTARRCIGRMRSER
jgi:integrase